MNPLEDELRSALRRKEPSPDFTARVLARVAAQQVRSVRPVRPSWVRWAAAIAAAILLVSGALGYRYYRGERAKSQVMLAMRITATKLIKAQKKVRMINASHRSLS